MDFFRAQDQARRTTGRLVILFTLAVISLIAMANLLVMAVFGYLPVSDPAAASAPAVFNWEMFTVVSIGVLAVVGLGSLYKISSLSSGGPSIAEMVGGQLIVDGSDDPDRQKILNVVEEMAIASGSPVPPVYLLDEEGINAFAAGYSPGDAVIGVTTGAIRKLSRDELQGVIAHEFSHIYNGDMRLNIKLIGILHGIVLLGLIGYHILRGSAYSRSSRKGGGGFMALGLGLVIIGFGGTFFGNLIRAAVSRQREYLSDASAVQFTRNPDGIAGALLRIGADSTGSVLKNSDTREISHALFSQGFTSSFGSLFATHPPLAVRIRKIKPDWDGNFETTPVRRQPQHAAPETSARAAGPQGAAAIGVGVAAAMAHIGNPTEAHVGYAREIIAKLPDELRRAVHEPYAARAVIYCLVLDQDAEMRRSQLDQLEKAADTGVYDETVRLQGLVRSLQAEFRLPLLDMSLPALRRLSQSQYELFRKNLALLIEADGKLTLFEWTLHKLVNHHLASAFGDRSGASFPKTTLRKSGRACSVLLSFLVYATRHEGLNDRQVFEAAARELEDPGIELLGREKLSFGWLDKAIDELSGLDPTEKEKLVKSCAAGVLADRKIAPIEAELLRAIADTLNCPMPPLLLEIEENEGIVP
ncbi:MAG: M48 family metallopeptidase [Desulfobulbaceae bacterium]|nr:M48 family metallopeptidase [Desulfobulbaceae bacterium]